MLSLFNFITVHSSYVYLLRNQHKFCKISKNTFFTEHFWATASGKNTVEYLYAKFVRMRKCLSG